MKGRSLLSVAVMLLVGGACASSPDWIQSTLVTTDVTGTWRGVVKNQSSSSSITLILEQRGPKVTGSLSGGPIDGTVEGDVFRFAQRFGAIRGEATVAGDEMAGEMSGTAYATAGRSKFFLRRGEPPADAETKP